ncbi:MAG: hypothetical protein N3E51_04940 [Candidatus Micrarchaeota archaeon]|nr:hypothetical protein [Candidatus Micrarchaeota archaeon]
MQQERNYSYSMAITNGKEGKCRINGQSIGRWRNFLRSLCNFVASDGHLIAKRSRMICASILLRGTSERRQDKLAERFASEHFGEDLKNKKEMVNALLESGKVTSPKAAKTLREFAGIPPLTD